ncbi:MAG: hypothetical protein WD942_10555 [Dehalococcoidia bacterium]
MDNVDKAIRDAAIAVAPLAGAYFSGWAYLSKYLNAFGIDPTQADIPIPTILVYASRPLYTVHFLIFLILVIAFLYGIRFISDKWFIFGRGAWAAAVSAGFFLLAVHWISQMKADEIVAAVWNGERPKTVALVQEDAEPERVLSGYMTCARSKRLVQVIGFPDKLYLLCRGELRPCSRGALYSVSTDGKLVSITELAREKEVSDGSCEPIS